MRHTSKQIVECISRETGCRSPTTRHAGGLRASLFFSPLVGLWLFTSSIGLQAAPVNVTLAWNPNVEASLAGYNVYYGTASRVYPGKMSVSRTATNATVTNLQAGQTYYFAVTATNAAGLESAYSAEVSYTIPANRSLQIRLSSNGQVILTVNGLAGRTYAIQASSDFLTWSDLGTVTLGSGGLAEFADLTPQVGTARFYRAVERSPQTLIIRLASNRQVILTVTGLAGHTYTIQATTNLTTWAVIGNVTVAAGGSLDFTDTNAPSFPRRFYRIQDTQP